MRHSGPSGNTPASRQNPVNPSRKNISLYRNSDLRHYLAIPVLGEGRSYVVSNVDRGAVDAAAPGREAGSGRDEPREVLGSLRNGRRQRPAKPLGAKQGRLRTAKARGPDRRCYGQALRRCFEARPGLRASPIREVTEARRNSAPGRARISRQAIAQGRPGVFRPTCYPPAHLRVQILRAADHGCQPAPGLPCALFTEEGERGEQNSGVSSRENADLCVM